MSVLPTSTRLGAIFGEQETSEYPDLIEVVFWIFVRVGM